MPCVVEPCKTTYDKLAVVFRKVDKQCNDEANPERMLSMNT